MMIRNVFSFALLVLLFLSLPGYAPAASVMLPSGEPDANCPDLRLWLRADSGIKDSQGRGSDDTDFNGVVAAWHDRSPQKFNLTAAPGHAPLLVQRQPAAGNRPAVAFAGQQVLTRSNSVLNDRPTSTVLLVVQGSARSGEVYSAGKGSDARESIRLNFNNEALAGVEACFLTSGGERRCGLDLALPGDGRAGGRFAVIVSDGDANRRLVEFHDGLGDMVGGERAVTPLAPQQSASDKCSREFYLGGAEQELFCGQVAEVMVFNRGLSVAERSDLLKYLRRRYELDLTDALYPPGTFLLQAEDFDGNWTLAKGDPGQYQRGLHVTAEGEAADKGIKTTIHLPRSGNYHIWLRAAESGLETTPPNRRSALRTIVQGKPLAVTHVVRPSGVTWRRAGEIELKAGPVEILVRGEGPGNKDCDAVLVSATAETEDEVEQICALARRIRGVSGQSRLTALFQNGLRLDGSLLTGWRWMGPAGQVPRPDPEAMPAMVCLQFDRRQPGPQRSLAPSPQCVLEFYNGDRVRGVISGFVPASNPMGQYVPARLLVAPASGIALEPRQQSIAVDVDWLRRIVFEPAARDRACPAKTVICRDGRRHAFRVIRWSADAVSVMTDEGLQRVPFANMAELRMADDDPWKSYYRELAAIDPEGKRGILRLETADGMTLTSRPNWLSPGRQGSEAFVSHCWLRPVWSRYTIGVPWGGIRLVWRAPAHVLPLSRFSPEQVAERGVLGSSWKWQADRNVAGGELRSGGMDYLWGLGVHAPNEIVFPIPACVRAFRTHLGIDDMAGNSGRAVAKVYLNAPSGQPLYQSKLLAGSAAATSTGEIALPAAPSAAMRKLVLVAEAAGDAYPAGGDPLDIGSHVDWLEPMLLLDPALLRSEVARPRADETR